MLGTAVRTVLLIGEENVGKTQLAASLTGRPAAASNFRGATVACESYRFGDWQIVDTPGLQRRTDTEAAEEILGLLDGDDAVLLVVQATDLDADLELLLPLVRGRQGALVVTFSDRVRRQRAELLLAELEGSTGLPTVLMDARAPTAEQRRRVREALEAPGVFPATAPVCFSELAVRPRLTILERPVVGPLAALALLLSPAWAAVVVANTLAEKIDPLVSAALAPAAQAAQQWPQPLGAILAEDYGLLTMGPLLLVWAAPVVLLHALLMGAYKASGLLDRLAAALSPVLRPFGLTGRELARVVMGFGCNVPAVISTRSSSRCSRGACISAIAFGSACSYQLGATLAVFSAAGRPWLAWPFLLYLGATTLLYTRLVSTRSARSPFNVLLSEGTVFLVRPSLGAVWQESRMAIGEFFRRALPIFMLIAVAASALEWLGVMDALAGVIRPAMSVFRLPPEAATAIVFAAIRKDGILLLAEPNLLPTLDAAQTLTGVYLAGVLAPCLVTLVTAAREQGARFAATLAVRQAVAAMGLALLLSWGAVWTL